MKQLYCGKGCPTKDTDVCRYCIGSKDSQQVAVGLSKHKPVIKPNVMHKKTYRLRINRCDPDKHLAVVTETVDSVLLEFQADAATKPEVKGLMEMDN